MPVYSPETEEFFFVRGRRPRTKKNSEVEAAINRHIARQNPIYIIYIPFFKARLTSARYFITTLPLQYILQDYFQ